MFTQLPATTVRVVSPSQTETSSRRNSVFEERSTDSSRKKIRSPSRTTRRVSSAVTLPGFSGSFASALRVVVREVLDVPIFGLLGADGRDDRGHPIAGPAGFGLIPSGKR
jgi:hypothetical protein